MNNEKKNNNEKETLTIIIHSLVGVGYFCEKKNFIVSSITNENEMENYHVHCAHIASTRENQQSQIEIRRNFSTNIMWLEHIFCSAVNLMLEKWDFFRSFDATAAVVLFTPDIRASTVYYMIRKGICY